jgi:hypothetical protein
MEDEHIALPAFVPRGAGSGAGVSLFGVFDGHGGRHCATFLKSARLPARASVARATPHCRCGRNAARGTEDGGGGRASRRALHRDLRCGAGHRRGKGALVQAMACLQAAAAAGAARRTVPARPAQGPRAGRGGAGGGGRLRRR